MAKLRRELADAADLKKNAETASASEAEKLHIIIDKLGDTTE